MVRHGYITKEEADMAKSLPITSITKKKEEGAVANISYIDTVIDEVMDHWGINPYTTPVEIYSNMDKDRQQRVDEIFNTDYYSNGAKRGRTADESGAWHKRLRRAVACGTILCKT